MFELNGWYKLIDIGGFVDENYSNERIANAISNSPFKVIELDESGHVKKLKCGDETLTEDDFTVAFIIDVDEHVYFEKIENVEPKNNWVDRKFVIAFKDRTGTMNLQGPFIKPVLDKTVESILSQGVKNIDIYEFTKKALMAIKYEDA